MQRVWRIVCPVAVHFVISQIVAVVFLLYLQYTGQGRSVYSSYGIYLTGLGGLLTLPFCCSFYRRDRLARAAGGLPCPGERRGWEPGERILLLLMGAGLSLCGNLLMSFFSGILNAAQYKESMSQITSGKHFLVLLFWFGIAGPAAEEVIFRWLVFLRLRDHMRPMLAVVLSAVLFGAYHGNLIQGFYSGLLGIVFALILEKSGNKWSSVFLHMGANVWSLFVSEYGMPVLKRYGDYPFLLAYAVLLVSLIWGMQYYLRKRDSYEI